MEQESRTMKEFIQEFRRIARESRHEKRPLVEYFKRGINRTIKRKLIEVGKPPRSIEQWHERVVNLDRH